MTGSGSGSEAGGSRPLFRAADVAWADCIQRAARGDQQGLSDLYDQSSRLVYSIVLRITGNPADAEEITLDVYTQVWRMARDYTPDRGSPTAWLTMLARSRALDRVRSKTARGKHEAALDPAFDAVASGQTAEESAMLSESRARIREAMSLLSPEQREAIELSFFTGLTHSELADRLGQPLGTVKTRIRLGMMRLRTALAVAPGEAI